MATPEDIGALLRAMRIEQSAEQCKPYQGLRRCYCPWHEAVSYFGSLGYTVAEPGDGPHDLPAIALEVLQRMQGDEDGDNVAEHIYGDDILLALVPPEVADAYRVLGGGFWYE